MNESWKNIVISHVALAVRVKNGAGRVHHTDRPFHGLVMNLDGHRSDYYFADGTLLHAESGSVFYLPKGSTYRVRSLTGRGCYAINFDTPEPLADKPFILSLRDSAAALAAFQKAARLWKRGGPSRHAAMLACLYDIIAMLLEEAHRSYLPHSKAARLAPATEALERDFAESDLSVEKLAALCGMSQPYFRKLFAQKFGMNPKAYITRLRMRHAKQLLQTGEFPVHEVAVLCGYGEACHFTREFTKHFGCSPLQYKNKT